MSLQLSGPIIVAEQSLIEPLAQYRLRLVNTAMDDFSGDIPFWDRFTVPGRPIGIVPYQLDDNDRKMCTNPAYTPANWFDYVKACFDQLYREGAEGNRKMISLGLHLRIMSRPGRMWALLASFKHVRAHDGVWIATRREIAPHLAKVDPA